MFWKYALPAIQLFNRKNGRKQSRFSANGIIALTASLDRSPNRLHPLFLLCVRTKEDACCRMYAASLPISVSGLCTMRIPNSSANLWLDKTGSIRSLPVSSTTFTPSSSAATNSAALRTEIVSPEEI